VLTLLPGSRTGEIDRHLPVMLEVAAALSKPDAPIVPVVALAPGISAERIDEIAVRFGYAKPVTTEDVYSAIAAADLALVKSGTGTVECAILGTPLIVMYKTSRINYHIARRIIKAEHIAMVNLIAGKAIVPEFIQDAATAENLTLAAAELLNNEPYRHTVIEDLNSVREKLGPPGGAKKAAEIIVDSLEGTNGL
jgi:lipid-A-disaccharide synthase